MHEEPYFVNFLRDAPEATGEEESETPLSPPKVYDMVSEWERLIDKLKEYMGL
jgi:dynein heavy chain